MKKWKLLVLAISLLGFVFNGCKKGTGDPAISLKTKKARISETWTMSSGKVGLTTYAQNQAPYNESFEFSGGGQGKLTKSNSFPYYWTLGYSLTITFEKDGKFKMTENLDGLTMICEGTWDFNKGVGDKKKKEEVFIQLETISSGDTQEHLFNHLGTELSYSIERLSKDELKIYANTNYYMNIAGQKGKIESTYTFNKQ